MVPSDEAPDGRVAPPFRAQQNVQLATGRNKAPDSRWAAKIGGFDAVATRDDHGGGVRAHRSHQTTTGTRAAAISFVMGSCSSMFTPPPLPFASIARNKKTLRRETVAQRNAPC
jgi:hypothetical protein